MVGNGERLPWQGESLSVQTGLPLIVKYTPCRTVPDSAGQTLNDLPVSTKIRCVLEGIEPVVFRLFVDLKDKVILLVSTTFSNTHDVW